MPIVALYTTAAARSNLVEEIGTSSFGGSGRFTWILLLSCPRIFGLVLLSLLNIVVVFGVKYVVEVLSIFTNLPAVNCCVAVSRSFAITLSVCLGVFLARSSFQPGVKSAMPLVTSCFRCSWEGRQAAFAYKPHRSSKSIACALDLPMASTYIGSPSRSRQFLATTCFCYVTRSSY
jgi:hypothetical protein